MIKKIFSLLVIAAGSVYLASCDNNEDVIKTFNSQVDPTGSSVEDDKYDIITVYSTDGGVTYQEYPNIKKGDTYLGGSIGTNSGNTYA